MTQPMRIETGDGPLRPWEWELVERGAGPDHVAVLRA